MKQLCLVLFAAVFFAACSSSTTPTEVTYNKVKLADAFSFDNYSLTSGGSIDASTRDTSVSYVDAINLTMNGKTGVFRVIDTPNGKSAADADTTYYAYESSNDLSMLLPNMLQSQIWIKLPVASNGSFTTIARDTVTDASGTSIEQDSIVATSMGDVSMNVEGETLTVRKVRMQATMVVKSDLSNFTMSVSMTGYYSPKLGFVTRLSSDPTLLTPATEKIMIGHVN